MWSVWLVFCDCGFHSVCPLMDKDKRLIEASWWKRLRGTPSLVLMGRTMFSKPLIKFSVDGWGCIPTLLFDLRPNYGGGNEDNGYLPQKVHVHTAALSAPTLQLATANPCLQQRLLNSQGQVWVSLLWGHCSFLLGPGTHKVLFVPSKVCFSSPVEVL